MLDIASAMLVLASTVAILIPGVGPRLKRPGLLLCAGTLVWISTAMLRAGSSAENPRILGAMFLAVGVTAASGFVLVSRLVDQRSRSPRWLIAAMIIIPVFAAVGTWREWGLDDFEDFRSGPVFLIHSVFSFGLLAAMILRLSQRQRDPSPRVRGYVMAAQMLVIAIIVLEVSMTRQTHVAVSLIVAMSIWIVRRPTDWWRAPTNADDLLNSIGVFLFVFDEFGRLRSWNSTAAQLVAAVRPDTSLVQGLPSEDVIGMVPPFRDGTIHDFPLSGGVLRTLCHTHPVDAVETALGPDWVVMFRPVRSRHQSAQWTVPSGELAGHDPSTQSLSRRAALAELAESTAAVRVDLIPRDDSVLVDEVMFVVARRLEAAFGHIAWGRIAAWSFVGPTSVSEAESTARALQDTSRQPLIHGLSAHCTTVVLTKEPGESSESFALRVGQSLHRGSPSGETNGRQ